MHRFLAPLILILLTSPLIRAQPVTIDDFHDLQAWAVIASDGVAATISPDAGPTGSPGGALRLDYDFRSGAGFCVVRRAMPIELPINYRLCFRAKGAGPANNFECKLVDPSGDNVWWVNRRAYEFPADWTKITYRARHFSFAWGPRGPIPLDKVGFLEFAIAASSGGKGSVWLDSLTFEPLPPTAPPAGEPALSGDGPFTIDLKGSREFGGLILDWDGAFAADYDIRASSAASGDDWETIRSVRGGNGGRDDVRIPDGEARRLQVLPTGPGPARLRSVRIMDPATGATASAMYETIAAESPRGRFPRYCSKEQSYWTVIGAMGDAKEGLLSADGALEVDFQGFTVEPFLIVDAPGPARLITWADTTISHSLDGGDLPIPTVTWAADGIKLEITALADGPAGESVLAARYRITNTGPATIKARLALAVRPFQVLPPWQDLRISGGTSPIRTIAYERGSVLINSAKRITPSPAPSGFGAAPFAGGDITEYLAQWRVPPAMLAEDPDALASAAMLFDLDLQPGRASSIDIEIPLHKQSSPATFDERLAHVREAWTRELGHIGLSLPASAGRLPLTFRTAQAHILINADGPAIQPGSRTYERSWIRDGSLTGSALLFTGHGEQFRAFLDWYAGYQYESGKIPCVVDTRGPDPVPEHDSTGQYLYAVDIYHRASADEAFARRHFEHVRRGVEYIKWLRALRMTDEYRAGPAEKRAMYGLVPESISHEGYSAKPMHSYWDDFFTLRGLQGAARLAQSLGETELAKEWGALRDDFEKCLDDSIAAATKLKGIDYIPGCVELGDFDAPSTAIAVYPCGRLGPEPYLTNTFERWYTFFKGRIDGTVPYKEYSPYETRLMGTFVRLGWRDRAQELLAFYLNDQRPREWNQWGEIVWRDPATPRFIGDMPHTWVASDFVSAVRSMFVYERDRDGTLVIGAGIPKAWLEGEGVKVERFPTAYGPVSFRLFRDGPETILEFSGVERHPPGGVVIDLPVTGRARVDGAQRPAGPVIIPGGPARMEIE
ncbi:MAG: coagulation factor 5/8 type domain-containing protein [Phycisphaerales bacterium]|nr:coagulation factor 5/8 type domain-containing protein [Phycisphaerales bacterium]